MCVTPATTRTAVNGGSARRSDSSGPSRRRSSESAAAPPRRAPPRRRPSPRPFAPAPARRTRQHRPHTTPGRPGSRQPPGRDRSRTTKARRRRRASPSVDHMRKAPVELRGPDEVPRLDPGRRRRQGAAVELAEVAGGRRSALPGEPEPVAFVPGAGAQGEAVLAGQCDAEAAGGQDDAVLRQLAQRLAERDLAHLPRQRLRQRLRVEAPPDRARIAGRRLHRRAGGSLEPVERVVEPLVDEPLQDRLAARAVLAERLERPVPPDDAARQEHRAARTVALLHHPRRTAELAEARSGDEPRHAGAGDDGHAVRRARSSACARRIRA